MDKDLKRKIVITVIVSLVLIGIASPFIINFIKNSKPEEISYNEFIEMAEDGKVKEVNVDFNKSTFTFEDNKEDKYETDNPKSEDFKKYMLENNIKVKETGQKSTMVNVLLNLLTTLITLAAMIFVMKYLLDETMGSTPVEYIAEDVNITFADIAGNQESKQDMKFLVEFLKEPKKYLDMGARLPKGVILYGSPGTGKTLTARAIAGEAGVPFFNVTGSDFVEMYVGLGARRVRQLFKEAKKNSPCIVFIDEIDALGTSRGNYSDSEKDQTINALLAEMDGFNPSEGVIVMAATNRVEDLDKALVRPGRFDRHIAIDLPDYKDRLEILNLYAENKNLADDINMEELAKLTIGFSGAGLESLLNEATILAVNRGSKVVEYKDIDEAHYKIIVKGNKKKDHDRSDLDTELTAYHEGGHALLGKLLTDNDIPKVTIIPSTSGFGGATFNIPKKMGLLSKTEIENEIITLYGGRAAEELLRGPDSITTGASNDIEKATEWMKQYFNDYGMSNKYGLVNISQIKEGQILEDVVEMSKRLYDKTLRLLEENKETLDRIAQALIEKETITGEELDELMKG